MRNLLILTIVISTAFAGFAQTCNSKAKLQETINTISEKPKVLLSNKFLYIIHPMIKKEDREREYKINGNLIWEANLCKITYTWYKQTKGPTSKSTIKIGETFSFNYPLNTLKNLLSENEFKGWEFSESLALDKQNFSGYKSTVVINGVEKNFQVYLKGNQLYAVSLGFANTGISHEKNVKESADLWYFSKVGDQLRFVKKFTIKASKNNSVPIIEKTTDNYQY